MRKLKFRVAYKTDERQDTGKAGWIMSKPFDLLGLDPCNGDVSQFNFSDGGYLGTDDADWKKELKWMQFTGLKDIKGKAIFEGDIVLKHDGKTKAKVLYGTDRFYLDPLWDGEAEDGAFQSVTIIGNIYENPELMK